MNTRMEGRLSRLEQHRGGSFAAWVGIPLAQWPDRTLEEFICSEGGEEWRSLTDADLLAILEAADPLAPSCGIAKQSQANNK